MTRPFGRSRFDYAASAMLVRPVLKFSAAVSYSAALGYLVVGLFWQTFHGWLPRVAVIAIGGVLAVRVATLFASMTSAAILNWKAIWVGGGVGVAALVFWWPPVGIEAEPPGILLLPLLLSSGVVAGTAATLPSARTGHFYHSSPFARFLHSLQGVLLFGMALPASLFWEWTRPYVVVVTLSAFLLWKAWGGACPVTLVENEARVREGYPVIPPDSGFIPDVAARLGFALSGRTVTLFLYGLGCSLCGWFGVRWMF